ncbi:MAG: hypothetical protein ACXAB2_07610 [Candidatus Hodarchaeales archaeon]|jgi:hypothetical protein
MHFYNIEIHDGRKKPIDVDRMTEFENHSLIDKLFLGREIEVTSVFEQLGSWILDFTNIHIWSKEIPDIDDRSARLFSLWAEDTETKKILGIFHGFFVLIPFTITRSSVRDFYTSQEEVPYYPMAIVNSFRTIIQEENKLDWFLEKMKKALSQTWSELRERTIARLQKGSDIWKRYIFSFDNIVHYTFLCPSIDRVLIDALQRNDYRISGVMQLLASSSPAYDDATLAHHISEAKKTISESD